MRISGVLVIVAFGLLLPLQAGAQLRANFRADELDYDSSRGDCDACVLCTPTCELYFKMGVFYSDTQQGDLHLYPGACGIHPLDDGLWNFANQTVVREIPNLSTSAQLFFALYDEDGATSNDDLLGVHFATVNGPTTISRQNNDASPAGHTYTACEGDPVTDDSVASRFNLSYSVWFTDLSPASPPALPPTPYDNGVAVPNGYDNDPTLDFQWPAASDPHSGIETYQFHLLRDSVLVANRLVGAVTAVTVCAAGCDVIHSVTEGSEYVANVRARNGASIQLQNQSDSEWSGWSDPVIVDFTGDQIVSILALTEPGGEVIPEATWQGDNTPYITWEAPASTAPIAGYSIRLDTPADCIPDTTATASQPRPLADGQTVFYVRAIDEAGNCGENASFEIWVELPDDVFEDGFESGPA